MDGNENLLNTNMDLKLVLLTLQEYYSICYYQRAAMIE